MKGVYPWIGGLALLVLFPAAEAAARPFTNREGKTIEAEVSTVRGGKVYLKQGVRNYAVEIGKLSDEDQAYIREWVRNNFKYNLSFQAAPAELKERRTSRRNGRTEKWENEIWKYDVEITNRSGVDLENVTVDFQAVIRDEKIQDPGRGRKNKTETARVVTGSKVFPRLSNSDSAAFSTQEIQLPGHEWEVRRSEVVYQGGERAVNYWWDNFSDESKLDGIWLRVYLQDRLIGEWKSQGKLIKDHLWAYEKKAAPPVLKPAESPYTEVMPDATTAPGAMPPPPGPIPAAPEIGGSGVGGRALDRILLPKRIQQKIQEIRRNPGDQELIRKFRALLDEQRRLIDRRRQL